MKKAVVCVNYRANPAHASCALRGSAKIADLIETEINRLQLNMTVERFACLGDCARGPNLKLAPGGAFLHGLDHNRPEEWMPIVRRFGEGNP